jgi:divalent metal cation (Fe/Co/Zn/Cd) transporter
VAAIALLGASVIILPSLAVAKRRVARRLESGALRADSTLTGVAALLAALSLLSAAAAGLGAWWADAVAAPVVSAVLGREGWIAVRASRARRIVPADD